MPLFQPYRAIGYITEATPFSVQRRGRETYVTVSVGKAWQIYNCAKLSLVFVGPDLDKSIRALSSWRDFTFAASGRHIAVFHRTRLLGRLSSHLSRVLLLFSLGDKLISVGEDRKLLVWDLASLPSLVGARGGQKPKEEDKPLVAIGSACDMDAAHAVEPPADPSSDLQQLAAATSANHAPGAVGRAVRTVDGQLLPVESSFDLPEGFTPTCVMHPDTYINKLVVGSEEGRLLLINFSSQKLVHEFRAHLLTHPSPSSSPPPPAIRCCVGSPALDTVAVGLASGSVLLLNLKMDRVLFTLNHDERAAVTAAAFRTDGRPFLATGGSNGVISVWDLSSRRLSHLMKDAHDGPVVSLHFFANEPLLMSSGADNSVKMWVFDSDDTTPRLLRFRSGHSAPPCCIGYYGSGRHILSAGHDRAFRVFSTIQDQQSRELSQGHVAKKAKRKQVKEFEMKLPKVVSFAAAEIRERDWANVVTCHEGDPRAYTWRLRNFAIGEHVLTPPGGDATPAQCCAISGCGNYVALGTSSGRIELFNLQSGQHRRSFQSARKQYSPAHDGAVTAVEMDAINRHVISAGLDGSIKVWDMRRGSLLSSTPVGSPIVAMRFHRSNGLAFTASDDFVLRAFDIFPASSSPSSSTITSSSPRLVRTLRGHSDRVTSLSLSSDARWLISSSMDRTVRVWDVPAGRQLDAVAVDSAVSALTLSPDSEMLATVHAGKKGIYLWANKAMYSGLDDVDLLSASRAAVERVSMPKILGSDAKNWAGEDSDEDVEEEEEEEKSLRMLTGGGDVEGEPEEEEGHAGAAGPHGGEEEEEAEEEVEDADPAGAPGKRSRRRLQGCGKGTIEDAGEEDVLEDAGLVRMAAVPRSQWMSLVNLEVIKARNKPLAPPKKPELAPFFLPTLPTFSGNVKFAEPAAAAAAAAAADTDHRSLAMTEGENGSSSWADNHPTGLGGSKAASRVGRRDASEFRSAFYCQLAASQEAEDYGPLISLLKSMSPSSIDLELRMVEIVDLEVEDFMETVDEDQVADIERLLDFLIAELESKHAFELVQAFMHRFLAIHGEAVLKLPELQKKAMVLLLEQRTAWTHLDDMFQSLRCMVGFYTRTQQV